jgi:hypothetical protein
MCPQSLIRFNFVGNNTSFARCLQKKVPLGNPDVLVCSVGTEIFFEATGASPEADEAWAAELDRDWNRPKAIEIAASFSELSPQVRQLLLVAVIPQLLTCVGMMAGALHCRLLASRKDGTNANLYLCRQRVSRGRTN